MRVARAFVAGLVGGLVLLAAGWAGVGLRPLPGGGEVVVSRAGGGPLPAGGGRYGRAVLPSGAQLEGGQFLVGASKVSIAPDPQRFTPDVPEGTCRDPLPDPGCLKTFDMRYAKGLLPPERGGHGIWVRALAISNGKDTLLLASADVVGWFYAYPPDVCADCGAREIRAAVGAELGIPPQHIVLASTHTHASANTLSSVPRWYFEQVRDAAKEAMRQAYRSMVPAEIDVGVAPARANNADRRIVTRAVPDYEVQWLRAVAGDGSTVGVLYNYAAHPTVLASNDYLHAGYPGAASARLEQELGAGAALFFASGLGNQTVVRSRGIDGLGSRLAEVILQDMAERPRRLRTNDIAADVREVAVPGDNLFLTAARAANVFVRDILPPSGGGPVAGRWGKNPVRPSCAGGGPLSVVTAVGGLRLGEAAIMVAPGEIFSTISLVTKDYLENATVVFVLALANDELGYIIPAEEFDVTAEQGPGLVANSLGTSQYEEVLSLHRCFGELVMDELIRSGRALGFVP